MSSRLRFCAGLCSTALLTVLAGCGGGDSTKAPDRFRTKFETPKGDFIVETIREWSPLGADRFHQLVKEGFFNDARFFRVVPGFVVQFGLSGKPAVDAKWDNAIIEDDSPGMSNRPGTMCFATRGPRSRTTQIFINLGDNSRLDAQGFTPFGRVTEGMQVVSTLHAGYGEGPDQGRIKSEGNAYLQREFPLLDFVKKASIVP